MKCLSIKYFQVNSCILVVSETFTHVYDVENMFGDVDKNELFYIQYKCRLNRVANVYKSVDSLYLKKILTADFKNIEQIGYHKTYEKNDDELGRISNSSDFNINEVVFCDKECFFKLDFCPSKASDIFFNENCSLKIR